MKTKIKNLMFWVLLSGVCIAADQASKALVTERLRGAPTVGLIPGVLELLYSENRGAAFGILQGRQTFFFLIAIMVLLAAVFVMLRLPGFEKRRYFPLKFCVSLITAGAVGNMIDRLKQGYVVDFIYFRPIDFPVFNVADIFVTCATALLMLLLLFYYRDEELDCLSFSKASGRSRKEERP